MTAVADGVKPNLKDDVEDIVNPHSAKNQGCRARIAREKKARRALKLCYWAGAAGIGALAMVPLGALNIVADMAAVIAGVGLACTGCFLLGRYVEAR